MDKYDGMHKVEVSVSQNPEIRRKEKKVGGFWKTFLIQSGVALVLGAALFGLGKVSSVTKKVKEAVCFDAFAYVAEWWEEEESAKV